MAETQIQMKQVLVSEAAIKRADEYAQKMSSEKGVNLSRGAVFAMGIDKLTEGEN